MTRPLPDKIALCCALVSLPAAALGHEEIGVAEGFISGFLHPLFGLDHVVAMVAVGLLGAVTGPPAIWLLPVVFPLVMAFGGVLGIAGVPLPGVEIGIALSGIVLGLLVAFAVRPPDRGGHRRHRRLLSGATAGCCRLIYLAARPSSPAVTRAFW